MDYIYHVGSLLVCLQYWRCCVLRVLVLCESLVGLVSDIIMWAEGAALECRKFLRFWEFRLLN